MLSIYIIDSKEILESAHRTYTCAMLVNTHADKARKFFCWEYRGSPAEASKTIK